MISSELLADSESVFDETSWFVLVNEQVSNITDHLLMKEEKCLNEEASKDWNRKLEYEPTEEGKTREVDDDDDDVEVVVDARKERAMKRCSSCQDSTSLPLLPISMHSTD
jgi:hypothetical protein